MDDFLQGRPGPRQGERIAEGLAWWGIAAILIAAIVGAAKGGGVVIYVLALIAAAVTITWFRLIPEPFASRPATVIAVGVYIATISASNYYTGGIHSPLFLLYFAPLLAAFFLFQPRLQIILGGFLHACFLAQFLTPIFLHGEAADWPTFLSRSLQLAALGFFAVFASRSTKFKVDTAEGHAAEAEERERRLLRVAQGAKELRAARDCDEVMERAAAGAASLFGARATFMTQVNEDKLDLESVIDTVVHGKRIILREQVDARALMQRAVINNDHVLVADGGVEVELIEPSFKEKYDAASAAAFPVTAQGRVVAVLGLAWQGTGQPDEDEEKLIRIYASEVGAQIERVRYKATAEAALVGKGVGVDADLGARAQIGHMVSDIGAAATLSQAAATTRQHLISIFDATDASLYLFHESNAAIQAEANPGGACTLPDHVRDCPAVRTKAPYGDLVDTEACKLIAKTKGSLCYPIIFGEHSIGVFSLYGSKSKEGVSVLASTVAAAISTPLAGVRSLEYREPSGFFDRLTDVFSWPYLEIQLDFMHHHAHRTGRPYSLVIFGLDNMREINKASGMLAGDRILQGFADAARSQLERREIFGRWREDLFILCLADHDKDTVYAMAQEIRRAAEELFAQPEYDQKAAVSAGIITSFGGGPLHEVLDAGLDRMKRAKVMGGNRIEARAV